MTAVEASSGLDVVPLAGRIGAEVRGVSLVDLVSPATIAAIDA